MRRPYRATCLIGKICVPPYYNMYKADDETTSYIIIITSQAIPMVDSMKYAYSDKVR